MTFLLFSIAIAFAWTREVDSTCLLSYFFSSPYSLSYRESFCCAPFDAAHPKVPRLHFELQLRYDHFVALLVFMKGTSRCVLRGNFKLSCVQWQIF